MAATPTRTTATRTPSSRVALERAIAPVESERFFAEHADLPLRQHRQALWSEDLP